jgi:hypothetical protein
MTLKTFVVLYRVESIMCPMDEPFSFMCSAENVDHAEEQFLNAYPEQNINIVWVSQTEYPDAARDDWYTLGESR